MEGGDVAKTLSKYFSLLDFGLNAPKTYGKVKGKPEWCPSRPKWKKFRNPSKATKKECALLVKFLLDQYGICAELH